MYSSLWENLRNSSWSIFAPPIFIAIIPASLSVPPSHELLQILSADGGKTAHGRKGHKKVACESSVEDNPEWCHPWFIGQNHREQRRLRPPLKWLEERRIVTIRVSMWDHWKQFTDDPQQSRDQSLVKSQLNQSDMRVRIQTKTGIILVVDDVKTWWVTGLLWTTAIQALTTSR